MASGNRTIGNFDDVTNTFPSLMHLARVAHSQFIASGKAHFTAFQLGQHEPCHPLLVQTKIPPHGNVGLRLALLESLIVVRLDFDQRSENILVLVCILIAQQDGLRFIIYAGLLKILERRFGVLAPQILEAVDLLERNLTRAQLFRLGRRFHKP